MGKDLEVGFTRKNGKGFSYTVKRIVSSKEVYVSFNPNHPDVVTSKNNALKGAVRDPEEATRFIGSTFETDKGGIFTVTGILPREKSSSGVLKNATYTGTCNICSKDLELFPEPFTFTKSNVLCGKEISTPCGCNKSTRYTSDQYKILVLRNFEGKNVQVKEWWSEEKPCNSTRFTYECSVCKSEMYNTISSAKSANNPCKKCSNILSGKSFRISSDIYTNRFRSKGWDVEIFEDQKGIRYLRCFTCKSSDFTVEGGCRYEFPTNSASLQNITRTCRCNSDRCFRWDVKEREFQINKLLKEDSGEFIGWESEYVKHDSRFHWKCVNGHMCTTSVDKFVNRNNRCRVCADLNRDISWSYNPENKGLTDYLYVLKMTNDVDDFIKVGRSMNPWRRFGEYRPIFNVEVLGVYKGLYEDIWYEEKEFHDKFKNLHYATKTKYYGRSESYTFDILEYTKFKYEEVTNEFQ